jgi:hypothetical protein
MSKRPRDDHLDELLVKESDVIAALDAEDGADG